MAVWHDRKMVNRKLSKNSSKLKNTMQSGCWLTYSSEKYEIQLG